MCELSTVWWYKQNRSLVISKTVSSCDLKNQTKAFISGYFLKLHNTFSLVVLHLFQIDT